MLKKAVVQIAGIQAPGVPLRGKVSIPESAIIRHVGPEAPNGQIHVYFEVDQNDERLVETQLALLTVGQTPDPDYQFRYVIPLAAPLFVYAKIPPRSRIVV